MTTFEQEIEKILKEYIRETITEGKGEPLIRRGIRQEKIETLLSLIQTTIREDIGQLRQYLNERTKKGLITNEEIEIWFSNILS